MTPGQVPLFSHTELFLLLEDRKREVTRLVDERDADYILNVSEEDFVQYLVDRGRLNVPVILEGEIHAEEAEETKKTIAPSVYTGFEPMTVTGTTTRFVVPFEGDRDLFLARPQTYTLSPPMGVVRGDALVFSFTRTDTNSTALRASFDKAMDYVRKALGYLRVSIDPFNASLPSLASTEFKRRKQRLLEARGMVEQLGMKIKRRDGVAETYEVPLQRRKLAKAPVVPAGTFKQDPVLGWAEYEDILKHLRSMSLVMELSPKAFEGIGEEHLRFHFLVVLNAVYEGQATGETFNYQGKTDILIRQEGKNIFIAECKFWTGEKAFLATIDQLLSYLSWRDTKAAVLVFSRNLGFSDVIATIVAAVPKHPNLKRDLGKKDETSFRYVFGHPEDSNRELTVTVMAFNIPTKA